MICVIIFYPLESRRISVVWDACGELHGPAFKLKLISSLYTGSIWLPKSQCSSTGTVYSGKCYWHLIFWGISKKEERTKSPNPSGDLLVLEWHKCSLDHRRAQSSLFKFNYVIVCSITHVGLMKWMAYLSKGEERVRAHWQCCAARNGALPAFVLGWLLCLCQVWPHLYMPPRDRENLNPVIFTSFPLGNYKWRLEAALLSLSQLS